MEKHPSSQQGDAISPASHLEIADDASKEPESSEDGYQMTKVTYLAIFALYWSWASASNTSTSTTTISHQVADVGGVAQLAWISNTALLVQIALQPICGSLGDHYGNRWVIILGSLFGVVGGIVAGRAHSIGQIIAGQALFGIAISTSLLAVPAQQEIVPSRYRPITIAGNQIVILLMVSSVVLITGATVKYDVGGAGQGWRWSYYIPAIIHGVNSLLNFLFYHPPPTRIRRGVTAGAVFKSLDLPGFFLFIAGLTLFSMALVWGGNSYAWDSAHTLATLLIGIAVLIIFGLYEWKGTNRGLLDHRLFKNSNFAILLSIAFVDGLLLFGMLVFMPQEVAAVFTNDAILQVLPLVAYTITTGIGGVLAGSFLFFTKRYRVVLAICLLWMALFIGLCALIQRDRLWMIYTWPALAGLGVGATTTLPSILTALSVPDYLIGTAVTLSSTMRSTGGIIGVTIFSSVYNNKYNAYATGHIAEAAVEAGVSPSDLGSVLMAVFSRNFALLMEIPGMTASAFGAILEASEESAAYGYKYVFITIFPFCLLCAGFVVFLKSVDKDMTSHVESKLEKKTVDDKTSGSVVEV